MRNCKRKSTFLNFFPPISKTKLLPNMFLLLRAHCINTYCSCVCVCVTCNSRFEIHFKASEGRSVSRVGFVARLSSFLFYTNTHTHTHTSDTREYHAYPLHKYHPLLSAVPFHGNANAMPFAHYPRIAVAFVRHSLAVT